MPSNFREPLISQSATAITLESSQCTALLLVGKLSVTSIKSSKASPCALATTICYSCFYFFIFTTTFEVNKPITLSFFFTVARIFLIDFFPKYKPYFWSFAFDHFNGLFSLFFFHLFLSDFCFLFSYILFSYPL